MKLDAFGGAFDEPRIIETSTQTRLDGVGSLLAHAQADIASSVTRSSFSWLKLSLRGPFCSVGRVWPHVWKKKLNVSARGPVQSKVELFT
jgi:hypothetical protein